jgi:hypothetical protein
MDNVKNRMVKRELPELRPAPPVAVPGKVTPCVSPCCGKAGSPIVKQTNTERGFARVQCSSCGRIFNFYYATDENPTPMVRLTRD